MGKDISLAKPQSRRWKERQSPYENTRKTTLRTLSCSTKKNDETLSSDFFTLFHEENAQKSEGVGKNDHHQYPGCTPDKEEVTADQLDGVPFRDGLQNFSSLKELPSHSLQYCNGSSGTSSGMARNSASPLPGLSSTLTSTETLQFSRRATPLAPHSSTHFVLPFFLPRMRKMHSRSDSRNALVTDSSVVDSSFPSEMDQGVTETSKHRGVFTVSADETKPSSAQKSKSSLFTPCSIPLLPTKKTTPTRRIGTDSTEIKETGTIASESEQGMIEQQKAEKGWKQSIDCLLSEPPIPLPPPHSLSIGKAEISPFHVLGTPPILFTHHSSACTGGRPDLSMHVASTSDGETSGGFCGLTSYERYSPTTSKREVGKKGEKQSVAHSNRKGKKLAPLVHLFANEVRRKETHKKNSTIQGGTSGGGGGSSSSPFPPLSNREDGKLLRKKLFPIFPILKKEVAKAPIITANAVEVMNGAKKEGRRAPLFHNVGSDGLFPLMMPINGRQEWSMEQQQQLSGSSSFPSQPFLPCATLGAQCCSGPPHLPHLQWASLAHSNLIYQSYCREMGMLYPSVFFHPYSFTSPSATSSDFLAPFQSSSIGALFPSNPGMWTVESWVRIFELWCFEFDARLTLFQLWLAIFNELCLQEYLDRSLFVVKTSPTHFSFSTDPEAFLLHHFATVECALGLPYTCVVDWYDKVLCCTRRAESPLPVRKNEDHRAIHPRWRLTSTISTSGTMQTYVGAVQNEVPKERGEYPLQNTLAQRCEKYVQFYILQSTHHWLWLCDNIEREKDLSASVSYSPLSLRRLRSQGNSGQDCSWVKRKETRVGNDYISRRKKGRHGTATPKNMNSPFSRFRAKRNGVQDFPHSKRMKSTFPQKKDIASQLSNETKKKSHTLIPIFFDDLSGTKVSHPVGADPGNVMRSENSLEEKGSDGQEDQQSFVDHHLFPSEKDCSALSDLHGEEDINPQEEECSLPSLLPYYFFPIMDALEELSAVDIFAQTREFSCSKPQAAEDVKMDLPREAQEIMEAGMMNWGKKKERVESVWFVKRDPLWFRSGKEGRTFSLLPLSVFSVQTMWASFQFIVKNVVAHDCVSRSLPAFLDRSSIGSIFSNGSTALFLRSTAPSTSEGASALCVPSPMLTVPSDDSEGKQCKDDIITNTVLSSVYVRKTLTQLIEEAENENSWSKSTRGGSTCCNDTTICSSSTVTTATDNNNETKNNNMRGGEGENERMTTKKRGTCSEDTTVVAKVSLPKEEISRRWRQRASSLALAHSMEERASFNTSTLSNATSFPLRGLRGISKMRVRNAVARVEQAELACRRSLMNLFHFLLRSITAIFVTYCKVESISCSHVHTVGRTMAFFEIKALWEKEVQLRLYHPTSLSFLHMDDWSRWGYPDGISGSCSPTQQAQGPPGEFVRNHRSYGLRSDSFLVNANAGGWSRGSLTPVKQRRRQQGRRAPFTRVKTQFVPSQLLSRLEISDRSSSSSDSSNRSSCSSSNSMASTTSSCYYRSGDFYSPSLASYYQQCSKGLRRPRKGRETNFEHVNLSSDDSRASPMKGYSSPSHLPTTLPLAGFPFPTTSTFPSPSSSFGLSLFFSPSGERGLAKSPVLSSPLPPSSLSGFPAHRMFCPSKARSSNSPSMYYSGFSTTSERDRGMKPGWNPLEVTSGFKPFPIGFSSAQEFPGGSTSSNYFGYFDSPHSHSLQKNKLPETQKRAHTLSLTNYSLIQSSVRAYFPIQGSQEGQKGVDEFFSGDPSAKISTTEETEKRELTNEPVRDVSSLVWDLFAVPSPLRSTPGSVPLGSVHSPHRHPKSSGDMDFGESPSFWGGLDGEIENSVDPSLSYKSMNPLVISPATVNTSKQRYHA